MGEENINQEFRLKNKEEIKNYFIKEINQSKMDKKQKKVCMALNRIEHFLLLASAITDCVSNFAFATLLKQ